MVTINQQEVGTALGRRMVVSGVVQGVGFRLYAARLAEQLQLRGEVWNRTDGKVEILATGDEHCLDEFEALLHNGPGAVESIVSDNAVNEPFSDGFIITSSR